MRNSAALAARRSLRCAPSRAVPSAALPGAAAVASELWEAPRALVAEPDGRCRDFPANTLVKPRNRRPWNPVDGSRFPEGGTGRPGAIAHGGDRGTSGDCPVVGASRSSSIRVSDSVNSPEGTPDSGTTEFGSAWTAGRAAGAHAPGNVSDLHELRNAPCTGGDRDHVRFDDRNGAGRFGLAFLRADVRR